MKEIDSRFLRSIGIAFAATCTVIIFIGAVFSAVRELAIVPDGSSECSE